MKIKELNIIWESLNSSYDSWKPFFKELSQAYDPGRQRFDANDTNKQRNFNTSIIDPHVTMVSRTLAGGMQSGVTNPTVPWISLKTDDPDLGEYHAVKVWLFDVSRIILDWLAKSNFYNVAPSFYRDMGIYSNANMLMQSDPYSVVRFYPQPIGSYRIANGARLDVDHWAREIRMTAQQIIKTYGEDNVSNDVKTAFNNSDYKTTFPVRQLIMPRESYNPEKIDAKNKPYASFTWEPNGDDVKEIILKESGFDDFPATCARWDVCGNDAWGSFGPGMLALGGAKGLQKDQLTRYKAQDFMADPALLIPNSMKNQEGNLLPGARVYGNPNEAIQPAMNVRYDISASINSIQDTRDQLSKAFFNDLFMSITNIDKSDTTATEIARRSEERLLMLAPVLSNVNEDYLDPVVVFTYKELKRRNMLPPAPQELEGHDIKIEYVSMLHQAQQIAGISSMERSVSFIGNLAAQFPEAAYYLNVDEAIRKYNSITGADPKIINSPDVVQQRMQQAQQAQQAQQNAEMVQPIQQGAQAAKLLSETDTGGQSALDLIRSNLGAAV